MKVMKYTALGLSLFIVMFLLCWLAGGFIALDYNVSNWELNSRLGLVITSSSLSVYFTGILAAHGVFK